MIWRPFARSTMQFQPSNSIHNCVDSIFYLYCVSMAYLLNFIPYIYIVSLFLHDERRQELNETAQWYFVIVASSRHLREFRQTLVGKRKKSGFRSMIIFGRTTHRTNATQNRKRHSQSTCKQHLTATTWNLLVLYAWGSRVYPNCARQNKETAATAAREKNFFRLLSRVGCHLVLRFSHINRMLKRSTFDDWYHHSNIVSIQAHCVCALRCCVWEWTKRRKMRITSSQFRTEK